MYVVSIGLPQLMLVELLF